VIQVRDLCHDYPGGVTALQNANLDIRRGELLAIIGQNGSGKTTLVKHFNGLLKPTKGSVMVFGKDTREAKVADLSKKVGYVFQNPDFQLFNLTVTKEIAFALKNQGEPPAQIEIRIREIAEKLGLQGLLDASPDSLDKGHRQLLAIASILVMEPEVLIVDEPTTGQDPSSSRTIMDLMRKLQREEQKTIIIVTHDMQLVAEYADRAIIVHKGSLLFDGPTREAFTRSELLQKTYLEPPQITLLSQMLGEYGVPPTILTVNEMCDLFGV
jgi:energy-coupling factor transport system ATP-binding protein